MNLQRISLAIIGILFLGNGNDGNRQREGGGQQAGEQFSKFQGEVMSPYSTLGALLCSMREARAETSLTAQRASYKTQCDRFVNEMSPVEKRCLVSSGVTFASSET